MTKIIVAGNQALNKIIFYSLEKSIKTYRQYAQKQLIHSGFDLTIDQWLVLKSIKDHDDVTQQQIAAIVFKDYASVTRIIELLVQKKYIVRIAHEDKRRFKLELTNEAEGVMRSIQKVINGNRRKALQDIDNEELENFKNTLHKIINNCS